MESPRDPHKSHDNILSVTSRIQERKENKDELLKELTDALYELEAEHRLFNIKLHLVLNHIEVLKALVEGDVINIRDASELPELKDQLATRRHECANLKATIAQLDASLTTCRKEIDSLRENTSPQTPHEVISLAERKRRSPSAE